MTSTVQTSEFMPRINSHARRSSALNSYQATVEDFDGCEYEYYVDAESYEAAASLVESIASSSFIQVYNMNLYLIC